MVILLFNAFTWYYMMLMVMEGFTVYFDAFRTVFYLAAIGSSLAGAVLSEGTKRSHVLRIWMGLGIASSLQLALTPSLTTGYISLVFIILGISFGLGMPSCLAYLADNTSVENRGRISALIFLLVNLSAFPLAMLISTFSLAVNSVILAMWRSLGLVAFVFLKPPETASAPAHKHSSLAAVFQDKSFTLYLIPWLMFSIIDALEKALTKNLVPPEFYGLRFTVAPIIASFSMLIGGLLSDRIGRKRVVTYGFVSLGVAYAIIGTAPKLPTAWNLYLIVDAVATGILWTTFILILWGDLSAEGSREKYYVVGNIPFLVNAAIPLSLMPLSSLLPAETAFSLASFFLFLAVIPLMYAPETLPQKKIELRRLKGYVEHAKKLAGKYGEKR